MVKQNEIFSGFALFLIGFLGFCPFPGYTQSPSDHWYFGDFASVDFNQDPPQAHIASALKSPEGCASISDSEGQLLFYTNGQTVWNRLHSPMPHGLGLAGDTSSSQSAIILPYPGNENLYFLFTIDNNIGSRGLSYSLIDMRADQGLGDVVIDKKNQALFSPASEKVSATLHANGQDYWLVAHRWNSRDFYVYRVSAQGLQANPQIFQVGLEHAGVNRNGHGYMKFSPDGSLLALALGELGKCELFQFNRESGLVQEYALIEGYDYVYGLEFSPDNSKLYLSFRYEQGIDQYDLLDKSPEQLTNSAYSIPTQFPIGALQLGPDLHIYAAKEDSSLGLIPNPNVLGEASGYVSQGLDLKGKKARLGLPNFVQHFFLPARFRVSNSCKGREAKFSPQDTSGVLSFLWFFGDSTLGIANQSSLAFPGHIYQAAGSYQVSLELRYPGGLIQQYKQEVTVDDPSPLDFDLGKDTTLCEGDTLLIQVPLSPNTRYQWQNNPNYNQASFPIFQAGSYVLEVENACGIKKDTLRVFSQDLGVIPPKKYMICPGEGLNLNMYTPGATRYTWQDGYQGSERTVFESGSYEARIETVAGCLLEKESHIVLLTETLNLLPDTVRLCRGNLIRLGSSDLQTFDNYTDFRFLWENGSTEAFRLLNNPDTTTVLRRETLTRQLTISGKPCFLSESVIVEYLPYDPPFLNLPGQVQLCPGNKVALDASIPQGQQYAWYELTEQGELGALQSDSARFETAVPGTYQVFAYDLNCVSTQIVEVEGQGLPTFEIEGRPICPKPGATSLLSVSLPPQIPASAYSYVWEDGSTSRLRTVDTVGTYSVIVSNACGSIEKSYNLPWNPLPSAQVELGPDTTLCFGQTLLLSAENPEVGYDYTWQDGSKDATFLVQEPGRYRVWVDNGCTVVRDAIRVHYAPVPSASFNDEEYLCGGEPILLNAENPNARYLWTHETGDTLSQGPAIWVEEAGRYQVKIQDSCYTVEYEALVLSFESATELGDSLLYCDREEVVLGEAARAGLNYLWQDGSQESIYVARESGWYWRQTQSAACVLRDSVYVGLWSNPLDLGPDTSLCLGEELILAADVDYPGALYRWSIPGYYDSEIRVKDAGQYWVEVDLGYCVFRDSMQVDYSKEPQVDLGPDQILCEGESWILSVNDPTAQIRWMGLADSNQNRFPVSSSGTYWVELVNSCAVYTDTIEIQFVSPPEINLGPDTLMCAQESIILGPLSTGPGVHYVWSNGETLNQIRIDRPGIYWLEARKGACVVRDSVEVFWEDCEDFLVPYNVITPNGDGLNDTFEIPDLNLSEWLFEIYNRHGNLIFSSDNYQNDWSCPNHPDGVYFYVLQKQDKTQKIKGWIRVFK